MESSYYSISEDVMEDLFEISFTIIQHRISFNSGLLRITHFEVFESPFIIPCEELIQDIPMFLRRNVANYLSEDNIELLGSQIITYYQEVIQHTTTVGRTTYHRLIPLIVYLHVNTSDHDLVPSNFCLQITSLYEDNEYMISTGDDELSIQQSFEHDNEYMTNAGADDLDESTEINQVIEQSMQHLFIVPATEKAIAASLKKIKSFNDEMKASQCSICLENYEEEDEEVLALPCDHFFHKSCIVNWLKTGHTCPLCRFELPIE